MTATLLTFAVYLLLMLAIGLLAWSRTTGSAGYFLGGRTLGPKVAALSAQASDMSGWLLLGLPGYAYVAGLEAIWLVAGLWLGTWLNWLLVAGRLRDFSAAAGDAITLPGYLEQRFDDTSGWLRAIAGFFILLFFLFYTSSGLVAGGKLFETVFDLPYTTAVVAGTAVILLYTLLGGFLAVSWTDAVQGLLMLLALVVVPVVALSTAGGWPGAEAQLRGINPDLLRPWTDDAGQALGIVSIVSLLGWGLGYFGQPHILARFMGIRHSADVSSARRFAMFWVTVSLLGAMASGVLAIVVIDPPLLDVDSEKVFIHLVQLLLHPVVAGVCLAAILAAIMSTADSQLLVASSALSEDLYPRVSGRLGSVRHSMGMGRIAVVVIALLAMGLALRPDSQVLDLVAYAWAGFGAAFGPVIILSLHWSRVTARAAVTGIVVGAVTVIVWKPATGGLFDLYELVPGFLFSTLAVVLVSLADRAGQGPMVDRYARLAERAAGQ